MPEGSDANPSPPADSRGTDTAGPARTPGFLPSFTLGERTPLLALARRAIASSLAGMGEPEPDLAQLPPVAALPFGCFVTLTVDGELRGCIGNVVARLPLHRAIVEHAIQAARQDRRFEPVAPDELGRLEIEISILSPPRPLLASDPGEVLSRLRPHRDGVLLRLGRLGATYLPQVWNKIPQPAEFMESLSRKAGLRHDGWRDREAQISIYEVAAFSERDPGPS